MLCLFTKTKSTRVSKRIASQNATASKLVMICTGVQHDVAKGMQRSFERLSVKWKLVVLSSFCVSAVALNLVPVYKSIDGKPVNSLNVYRISPRASSKTKVERTNVYATITEDEYRKTQRFKTFMDSLARSPSGKSLYKDFVTQRPHLMDSLLEMGHTYHLQKKIQK